MRKEFVNAFAQLAGLAVHMLPNFTVYRFRERDVTDSGKYTMYRFREIHVYKRIKKYMLQNQHVNTFGQIAV